MSERKQDLERLIRIAGSQKRLAEALETTEETVSRWMNGTRSVPKFVTVVLELMLAMPAGQWPKRWQ